MAGLFCVPFDPLATAALSDAESREAAAITFIVAASGSTLFGIGGAMPALAR